MGLIKNWSINNLIPLKFSIFLFVILVVGCTNKNSSGNYSLAKAKSAFNQVKIDECRKIYEKIISDINFRTEDRVFALQTMAHLDWKIYKDYNSATKRIKQAISLNILKSRSWTIMSQIEVENQQFQQAIICTQKALESSDTQLETENAEIAFALAVLDKNLQKLKLNHPPNINDLPTASNFMYKNINKHPGKPTPSELLFGISFCLNDGPGMLKAWKSFYHIYEGQKVEGILFEPFYTLNSILPSLTGKKLKLQERKKLVQAFAQSRFYDYAALLVTLAEDSIQAMLLKDPEIYDIVAYADFIESFSKVNENFYPQIAQGLKNYNNDYNMAVETIAKTLWEKLHFKKTKPKFTHELFFNEIKKRYGAFGYSGYTVNYYCWLLGHVICDETKSINQYNYEASFQYISLDRIISRDFTSWLGTTNVGGWGTDSTVVEIRDSYSNEPFQVWNWVNDRDECKRMEKFCENSILYENELCKQNPYADPPGLYKRLRYYAAKQIYDNLKHKYIGDNLCLAFISEYKQLKIESLIFAHEGRHAIDQKFFQNEFKNWDSSEREFRAKLSEVAFSRKPKFALTGSILGANLGKDTDHGQANRKIRKLVVDWMTRHHTEIPGVNILKPMLPQIHLLNGFQLKNICRHADPLYKHQN